MAEEGEVYAFIWEKTETKNCGCGSCGLQIEENRHADEKGIKILGSGCKKCVALEKAVREALAENGMETTVEHITDFSRIASYGVMSTPALVIDGEVVSYGKVLTKEEVQHILNRKGQDTDE